MPRPRYLVRRQQFINSNRVVINTAIGIHSSLVLPILNGERDLVEADRSALELLLGCLTSPAVGMVHPDIPRNVQLLETVLLTADHHNLTLDQAWQDHLATQ